MVKAIKSNWLLILILILALFLRTYRIDYVELFGDELDAGYQSYSLLTTGRDYKGNWLPTYIHSFSEWRAPGLMYAMMPFIKLFGLNEWGVRLGPAVFGVLSIWGFCLLMIQIKVDKKVALATTFLLSITPWHIQYSRAAFEITLLSCFLIFGLYFLIRKRVIVAAVLLALSLYIYSSANVLMPALALLTLYFFRLNRRQFLTLLVMGLVITLPLIYQIIFGNAGERFSTLNILSHKDIIAEVNDYRNDSSNTIVSKILYNKYIVSAKRVLFNYSNAFSSSFLFNEGDVTFRHSLHQVGNLFWIQLPLIIWGLVSVLRHKKYYWLLGFLLISPIASSLTIDGYNHATRLFMMVYPLSFLAAYGLVNLSKLKVFLILILLFEFGRFQYYYWNFYRNQSWRWWHVGYKESMKYVRDNKDKYQKVIMDNVYEPTLIRFLFWNGMESRLVFDLADNKQINVEGFMGFCLEDKYCFVNFADKFKSSNLDKDRLYLVSHERSVGGDWNWGTNPPEGIKVMKTIYNYQNQPIFYLVEKL